MGLRAKLDEQKELSEVERLTRIVEQQAKVIEEREKANEKLQAENEQLKRATSREKALTIRDLLRLVAGGNREIFIKPHGCRYYYDGTIDDVPKSLLDVTVRELSPQIYRETEIQNPIRNYYWGLGVWVDDIPALNEVIDSYEKIGKDFSELDGKYIDELYKSYLELVLHQTPDWAQERDECTICENTVEDR